MADPYNAMSGELPPATRMILDRMGALYWGTALNMGNAFIQAANGLWDRGGYHPGTRDTQGVDDANTLAGVVSAGSLAVPRPRASLGAGGRGRPPNEPPTITGGGTGYEPYTVPNSSRDLAVNREGVQGAETVGRLDSAPELAPPANVNAMGPTRVHIERPTVDGVLKVLDELGIQAGAVRRSARDGTAYIEVPDAATGQSVTIRVSQDGHVGFPKLRDVSAPNYFDTGSLPMTRERNPASHRDPEIQQRFTDDVTRNEGGGLYADMGNLRDALAWRFSRDLVPPDAAPRTQRLPREGNAMAAAEPASPDQLRLLSAGIPIWNGVMEQATGYETDPAVGRFAEPRLADAALLNDTRDLTQRISHARAAIRRSLPLSTEENALYGYYPNAMSGQ